MADIQTVYGTFTKATGTGNQSVSTLAFQPKAVFFWWNNHTAQDTFEDAVRFGCGLYDGTFQVAISAGHADGGASADTLSTFDEAFCMRMMTEAGFNYARAAGVSLDTNGFTVNWTINNGLAETVHFLAVGGAEVQAKVGVVDSGTAVTTVAATGVGFQPSCLLLMPVWSTATTATGDCRTPAIGVTDGVNQGCMAAHGEDNVNPSNTTRYQRTDKCVAALTNTGALLKEADISSMDADGFTLNWTTNGAPDGGVYYLAIRMAGASPTVGAFTQKTSSGTKAVSGLAAEPQTLLFLGVGNTASGVVVDGCRASIGAYQPASDVNGAAWHGSTHGVTPTEVVKYNASAKAVIHATPNATAASSTIEAEAEVSAIAGDGFTLNWTTADAVAREVLFLSLPLVTAPPEAADLFWSPPVVHVEGGARG